MSDEGPLNDVLYDTRDNVAVVALNRPTQQNALREQTLADLKSACETAEADDTIRALLVQSADQDVFCAGADLNMVLESSGDTERLTSFLGLFRETFNGFEASPLPVIGCVTGPALAGGLELLLVCDLVVASEDAVIGDQHANVNLIPGAGGTQRLPQLVGPRRAKELVFTGKRIDASTAAEWGLINEVTTDPEAALQEAQDLAKSVAEKYPGVIKRTKGLIDRSVEMSMDSGLELEAKTIAQHLREEEVKAGIRRFLEE